MSESIETVPVKPMRHTATIETHDGRWYRYVVYRQHGIGLPEKSTSRHRTLAGARRAALRWTRRDHGAPVVVDRYGFSGLVNL